MIVALQTLHSRSVVLRSKLDLWRSCRTDTEINQGNEDHTVPSTLAAWGAIVAPFYSELRLRRSSRYFDSSTMRRIACGILRLLLYRVFAIEPAAMAVGDHIAQHWSLPVIVLSYLISATGSFCTIQLMEQWRQYDTKAAKSLLLVLSAISLGGCGIWCTHFTGMNALALKLDDGTELEIHFELGLTIVSFLFPVMGVYVGLKIASKDPFFLEIEGDRRKQMLMNGLKKTAMKNVVKKGAVNRRIQYTALFSRLWHILGGGFFAALGVLGMHYLGMSAQRANATMELDGGVVGLSCVIAFATANAAFWILFRAHTFWPDHEGLRVASALIMAVAVCGTHYAGMGSASYFHSDEDYHQGARYLVSGAKTSIVASHAAILICYWLTSLGVTKSVRQTEARAHSKAADERTSYAPNRRGSVGPKTDATRMTHAGAHTNAPSRAKVYVANVDTERKSEV